MRNKTYYVGIYVRLSNEDERAGESVSIENQKSLLTKYAKKQGWIVTEVYCDDGYSGTNFDRPAFQRMLADIKDGRINLVIVKDLSRLGRNHVLVGQFTEQILPAFGCRFIALNNNIDTLDRDSNNNDLMGFLNLFNEFHSRDTSRKVKSVRKACAERGQFLGTYAPFGYRKSDDDKHLLVVDEETAPVVRRIFKLRCEGKSFRAIATQFNAEHVPSPRAVYYQRKNAKNPKNENGLWNESTVKSILRSEAYIGHMVQGKVGTLSYKSRKLVQKDQEDWIRVENTHEPLISAAIWNQVCDMDEKGFRTRKQKSDGQVSIFTGLVLCADCGFKMRAQVERGKRKDGSDYKYVSFLCGNYSRSGKTACTTHSISEKVLTAIVIDEIREKARMVQYDEDDIIRQILREKDRENSDQLTLYEREIQMNETRLQDLGTLIQNLYEDRLKNSIPEGIFQGLMEKYDKEQQERRESISDMQKRLREAKRNVCDVQTWAEIIKKYVFLEELSQDILLELIDSVEVGETQEINGQKTRDIKIVYRMVGDISGIRLAERTVETDAGITKQAV